VQGFGESNPVDTNTTDAGRQRNRRVEFKVQQGGNM
jgi:outer membrane protein OmpA-like peptidoglycan-associated protein